MTLEMMKKTEEMTLNKKYKLFFILNDAFFRRVIHLHRDIKHSE